MSNIRVLKFGGTSMADEQTWLRVIEVIKSRERPLVVVSATARTTRRLIAAAEAATHDLEEALQISSEIRQRHFSLIDNFLARVEIADTTEALHACQEIIDKNIEQLKSRLKRIHQQKKISPQLQDGVASIGEQLSSALFAQCARLQGLNTRFVDARTIIKTNSDFGNARPLTDRINQNVEALQSLIEENTIPIIGGYYGENKEGVLTTLGFEGSDYTASLIGAALNCDAIEIWTDVSGIFTSDPHLVEEATPIPELSFQEATEMAYFGAQILHPSTLKPAAEKNTPVYVRNLFNVEHPGTKIHADARLDGPVRAVTFSQGLVIITVNAPSTLMGYHFLVDVFEKLEQHHVAVDVVTTTEASVSIAVQRPAKLEDLLAELRNIGEVSLTEDQGIISLISFNPTNIEAINRLVFSEIGDTPVSLVSFSRDKRNLNLILPEQLLVETARSIHRSLFSHQTISE